MNDRDVAFIGLKRAEYSHTSSSSFSEPELLLPRIQDAIPEFLSHNPLKRSRADSPTPAYKLEVHRFPVLRPFSPRTSSSMLFSSGANLSNPLKRRGGPLDDVPRTLPNQMHVQSSPQRKRIRSSSTQEPRSDSNQINRTHQPSFSTSSISFPGKALDPNAVPFIPRLNNVVQPMVQETIDHQQQMSYNRGPVFPPPFVKPLKQEDAEAYLPFHPRPIPSNNFSSMDTLSRRTSGALNQKSLQSEYQRERLTYSAGPYGNHHASHEDSGDNYDQMRLGKRRRGNLPKPITDLLRKWLHAHINHPYPTEDQKQELVAQTGLTMNQISNWFINARRRRLPVMSNEAAQVMQNGHQS